MYITKWLHASLRRVATVQKRIAADIRKAYREAAAAEAEGSDTGCWPSRFGSVPLHNSGVVSVLHAIDVEYDDTFEIQP